MKTWKKVIAWTTALLLFCTAAHDGLAARIVIDPGHGGRDPGAIGINGLYEKTVNLDIARKTRDLLLERGYDVLLTREEDTDMSLQERVDFKELHKADLFVSIHANANRSRSIQGTMVLYYDDLYPQPRYPASPEMAALSAINRQFAQIVLDEVIASAGTQNRGIVPSAVYVARLGTMPSILVETAFLSNAEDAARLADDSFRQSMALGIANGISRFLPPGEFMDVSGHWAKEAIHRVKELGIVQGYRSRFEPDRPLSRAEFIAMADRLFGLSDEDASGSDDREAVDGEADGNAGMDDTGSGDPDGALGSGEPDREGSAEAVDTGLPDAGESTGLLEPEDPTALPVNGESPQRMEAGGSSAEMADGSVASLDHGSVEGSVEDSADGSVDDSVDGAPAGSLDGSFDGSDSDADTGSGEADEAAGDGEEQSVQSGQVPQFTDLDESHWAYDILVKAAAQGYVQGYPDGSIRPEAPISRAEVSALFDRVWKRLASRVADGKETADSWPFADVPRDSWYASAVIRLKTAGLLVGTAPRQFAPERNMTRAEAAVLFDRFISGRSG